MEGGLDTNLEFLLPQRLQRNKWRYRNTARSCSPQCLLCNRVPCSHGLPEPTFCWRTSKPKSPRMSRPPHRVIPLQQELRKRPAMWHTHAPGELASPGFPIGTDGGERMEMGGKQDGRVLVGMGGCGCGGVEVFGGRACHLPGLSGEMPLGILGTSTNCGLERCAVQPCVEARRSTRI